MHTSTDIALIGAGPAGLEMALALQHARLPYLQLEASQIGATMAWWPPATRWFSSNDRISIAGIPLITAAQEKATREEYLAYLRAVVLQFDLPIRLHEPVASIQRSPSGFILHTSHHSLPRTIAAHRIILATGGTASPRLLNVPGENLPHVSHYLRDPHQYFRQKLLIVGGRNGAVEAALRCYKAGADVTLSYRGATIDGKDIKYWLWPEFESLTRSGKIRLHCNTTVHAITPEIVTLLDSATGNFLPIPADFILSQIGYLADMSLFESLGITLSPDRQTPAFNPDTMETNVKNVYVCGTATAGTQGRFKVFLENCHVHIPRILNALQHHPQHIEAHAPTRAEE